MKTRITALLQVLALLIFACSANQPLLDIPDKKELDLNQLGATIDSIASVEMQEQHIPGMAYAIVKDGKTILKNGYGYANMYTGKKVDPDQTIFRIGSISKAVTLLALTQLIDQGLINYDDDVTKYFPDIKNPHDYEDPLQVKHLLSHTTGLDQVGLDRHTWQLDLSLEDRDKLRPSITSFLQQHAIRRAPAGMYYTYDTYGTTLAGAIIAKVVGLPYKAAMKKIFFDPLGMHSSAVDMILENHPQMALGHGFNDDEYQTMPFELYTTTPASSIDATVSDMGRLMEVLTGEGHRSIGRFFTEKTIGRILNDGYRAHPEFVGTSHGLHEGFYYGAGSEAYEVRSLAHGGDMYGYKAQFRWLPDHNVGIIVLANRNRESGGGRVRIERSIINAVLDELGVKKRATTHEVPSASTSDLSEYTGEYVFAVHCHTCTEEDYANGAWRPGWNREVTSQDGYLILQDEKYFQRDKDVFVREDGLDMLFFFRDPQGKVIALQPEDDNNTFEKIE